MKWKNYFQAKNNRFAPCIAAISDSNEPTGDMISIS
jgi:hypothetical protein